MVGVYVRTVLGFLRHVAREARKTDASPDPPDEPRERRAEPRPGRAPPLPLETHPLYDDADVAAFDSSA
jgi:hypothetical protein